MKKTIILILVLLPIVLLTVIAVAGKFLSLMNHISVESVAFVDRIGTVYDEDTDFVVPQGGTRATSIVIYPELASNKKVTYSTSDATICTVSPEGVVSGVHWGTAVIMVKTQDSGCIARLNVVVSADVPFDVSLSHTELTMYVGGASDVLQEIVDAPVSLDKSVKWSSSNEDVLVVDELLGTMKAKAPGEVFVTVTTVSGGKTATCKVTVLADEPPMALDFSGTEGVEDRSDAIYDKYLVKVSTLDLAEVIRLGDGIRAEDVTLEVSGSVVSRDGWVLTASGSGLVNLTASVVADGVTHTLQVQFLFNPQ